MNQQSLIEDAQTMRRLIDLSVPKRKCDGRFHETMADTFTALDL